MKNFTHHPPFKNLSIILFSTLFLLTAFAFSKISKNTPTVANSERSRQREITIHNPYLN